MEYHMPEEALVFKSQWLQEYMSRRAFQQQLKRMEERRRRAAHEVSSEEEEEEVRALIATSLVFTALTHGTPRHDPAILLTS